MTVHTILYLVIGLLSALNHYLATAQRKYWLIPFWPVLFMAAFFAAFFIAFFPKKDKAAIYHNTQKRKNHVQNYY